jgi:hypothetical protein
MITASPEVGFMGRESTIAAYTDDARRGTMPGTSAAAARPFVGDVADAVGIECFRSPLIVVGRNREPAFTRVLGLRARRILLVPAELDSPAEFASPS